MARAKELQAERRRGTGGLGRPGFMDGEAPTEELMGFALGPGEIDTVVGTPTSAPLEEPPPPPPETSALLRAFFDEVDSDGDGKIRADEMGCICHVLGLQDVDSALAAMGMDSEALVSFAEFETFMEMQVRRRKHSRGGWWSWHVVACRGMVCVYLRVRFVRFVRFVRLWVYGRIWVGAGWSAPNPARVLLGCVRRCRCRPGSTWRR
jgi:hypothetical protein